MQRLRDNRSQKVNLKSSQSHSGLYLRFLRPKSQASTKVRFKQSQIRLQRTVQTLEFGPLGHEECLDIMSQVTSRVPEMKEEIKNGHWHIELRSQQTGQRKSSTSQIKNLEFKDQNQRDAVKTRVKNEGVSGLSQHPEAKGHQDETKTSKLNAGKKMGVVFKAAQGWRSRSSETCSRLPQNATQIVRCAFTEMDSLFNL